MLISITLLFSVFIYLTIIIIFNGYGIEEDRIKNRISALENIGKIQSVDDELNQSLTERFVSPFIEKLVKRIAKLLPNKEYDSKRAEASRRLLRRAGLTMMPSEYSAIRLIAIVGTAVLFFLMGVILNVDNFCVVLMPVLGAYIAFAVMRFSLMSRITKRKEKMSRQLPDVLDMLSVNVEAGLGFEQAMLHVIEHFQGPLVDELNITYREMSMGRSRRDALTLLGERCDIDDLKSFTGSVIQANKLGISLKNVLHTQAESIRESHRSKIEEKAQKMSVKILIPMVMFIFPVIFIVLMGPAVVSIMEMFGAM